MVFRKVGEWYHCQLAVDGILSTQFDVHASHVEPMSEHELGRMLERQAKGLIDRYGDARWPQTEEMAQAAELEAALL